MVFIPVHTMHTLVLGSVGNGDYLMGAQRRGKIHVDTVKRCLGAALEDMEDASYSIHRAISDAGYFPLQCQQALEGLFDKCSARQFPLIFRYMFATDEEFKKEVASDLQKEYGLYEELDWETVIRPLPNGWDEEGRAAKRQKTDDDWLIQLGSSLGAD